MFEQTYTRIGDSHLKFYTMDWWRGVQRLEHYDPTPDFQRHLAKIRDKLPPDLLALQESISLHDANIRHTHFNGKFNTLEISLDGDDGSGGLRRFQLRYTNVVSFRTVADLDNGLPGPRGYGDLGYHEADITEDGHFEHCLLFSTGIEFLIVFGEFELNWQNST